MPDGTFSITAYNGNASKYFHALCLMDLLICHALPNVSTGPDLVLKASMDHLRNISMHMLVIYGNKSSLFSIM